MNISYANIIPLIGGMSIANAKIVGKQPDYVVSYNAFRKNEEHLRRYYKDMPYYVIDEDSFNPLSLHGVDFVSSVCPCAGLSMLNSAKGTDMSRGACAAQNEWMYKAAEFVLNHIKPRVYWGEMAPALFTNSGKLVADKLYDIASKYNMSFSIVKTTTALHGIPQNRIRTFYFFWDTPTAPVMDFYKREHLPLFEYLNEVSSIKSHHNDFINEGAASEFFLPYKYILEKEQCTHAEFIQKNVKYGTAWGYIHLNDLWDDCIKWLKDKDRPLTKNSKNTFTHMCERIKQKTSIGKGYWDNSPHFPIKDRINALIGKNMYRFTHPKEDRFLNIREMLHLMGLPNDFELLNTKSVYHISQNVPVNTAADYTTEVVKFLNGDLSLSTASYLKQDNIRKIIEYVEQKHKQIQINF